MDGKKYEDLKVGDTASFCKTVSESDVYQFAGVTGDFNPVHVNKVAAEKSIFKGQIAHGILSAGIISAVIGTQLPGPGTIYLSQTVSFKRPVHFGDTLTATATVVEKCEKNRIRLHTDCTNQLGETVVDGEAVVIAP